MNKNKATQEKEDKLERQLKVLDERIYKPCTSDIEEWFEYKIDAIEISEAYRRGDGREGETDFVGIRTGYHKPPPGYWANPERRTLFAIINIDSPINNHVGELSFLYKNMEPVSQRRYEAEERWMIKREESIGNICVPIGFQDFHKKAKKSDINNWITTKLHKAQDDAIETREKNILKRLESLKLKEERRKKKTKSKDRKIIIEFKINEINGMINTAKRINKIKRDSIKGKRRKKTVSMLPQNIAKARSIAFAAFDAAQIKGDDASIVDVTKIYSGMSLDREAPAKKQVTRIRETVYRLMQTGFVIQKIYNHNPDLYSPDRYMPCDNIPFVWPCLKSHILHCTSLEKRARAYQSRTGKERPEWDVPLFTEEDIKEMKEMEARKTNGNK